jgi:hypothetical protein
MYVVFESPADLHAPESTGAARPPIGSRLAAAPDGAERVNDEADVLRGERSGPVTVDHMTAAEAG